MKCTQACLLWDWININFTKLTEGIIYSGQSGAIPEVDRNPYNYATEGRRDCSKTDQTVQLFQNTDNHFHR